ncbi:MAG: hypothetical protein N2315_00270 [Thermanaerothrix sp.]|nr:hypothetical protein [Thermanaerothrix sp.]
MGFSTSDVIRRSCESWAEVLADSASGGLFSERSFSLVEAGRDLGPFPEPLLPLLEGPDALGVVLVTAEQVPKGLEELVSRGSKKVSLYLDQPIPRFGAERLRWIYDRAKMEGLVMTRDALAFISESFEDREEICGELRKLSLLGREVSLEDVAALCVGDGQRRLVSFLDDLCLGRRLQAIGGLEFLKRRDDLLPVITALHNRFRLAFYVARFGERWVQGALSPRPYALKMAVKASQIYVKGALARFLRDVIEVNLMEKMGLGSGWARLDLAVFLLLEGTKR